jgi:hypothetical protein
MLIVLPSPSRYPMRKDTQPLVTSFVLRFVQDKIEIETASPPFRGTIQHIQSDEEIQFTHWEDAVDFIRQFVSIDQVRGPIET